MKRTLLLAWIGCLIFAQGFAQDADTAGAQAAAATHSTPVPARTAAWGFRSEEYGGFTTGQDGTFGTAYTINGVRYRTWSIGAGAGVDFYRYRTIPLFLSLEKELPVGQLTGLFVRLDAGTNLPWQKGGEFLPPGYGQYTYTYAAGGYWDGMVGYKVFINARHSQALLFTAGYSFKQVDESRQPISYTICPLTGPCYTPPAPSPTRYHYYNRRMSMQVGWQF